MGLLEHPELWVLSEQHMFYLLSSKTIVGGLIGVKVTKKFFKIHHSSGDLFCFPLILGMMIGRVDRFYFRDGFRGWDSTPSDRTLRNIFSGADLAFPEKKEAFYPISRRKFI